MYGFWCVQIIHKQKTKLQRRQKVTEKVFFVCWKMSIKNTRHYFELTCREAGNVSWINNSQATWRRQCQKKESQKTNGHTERTREKKTKTRQVFMNVFFAKAHRSQEARGIKTIKKQNWWPWESTNFILFQFCEALIKFKSLQTPPWVSLTCWRLITHP